MQSIPYLASYPQAKLVGNTPSRLANELRVYLGCTTQVDYDAGVLPYDSEGSLMGKLVGNMIGLRFSPLCGSGLRMSSPM